MTALLENAKIHRDELELFRFTAERFDQLVAKGFITSEDRVELLDGQIVRKPDVNPPHLYRVKDIYDRLLTQFRNRATTISQSTIVLPQDGRPDPDIALLRLETPRTRLPLPEDIHLVIEVADTTLSRDRDFKLALYARTTSVSTGSSTSNRTDSRCTVTRTVTDTRRVSPCATRRLPPVWTSQTTPLTGREFHRVSSIGTSNPRASSCPQIQPSA
ncbi:MAG: Uma2 family endonuclease [Pleurocapsa sp. SU_196_0]|nr:Uma2 family endonuclease [Pleurocapsa sp. SU_196_0]